MGNSYGVVTEADVQAARLLVDAWLEDSDGSWAKVDPEALLELRGRIVQLTADARTAGYLEGQQRGRQEAAHVVLDALRGEGLAP